MLNDSLANALSKIMNYEKTGKDLCIISPVSKTIRKIFSIMQKEGYIGEYSELPDKKHIKLNLLGKINKCGVIKPNYPVKKNEFEKFEKRYLPAKDFGVLILSTNNGLMTHIEAKEKRVGGKLLVYCY